MKNLAEMIKLAREKNACEKSLEILEKCKSWQDVIYQADINIYIEFAGNNGLLDGIDAWEKYREIERPAWEKYQEIEILAMKKYQEIEILAMKKYQEIEIPAMKKYREIEIPAWEEMKSALIEYFTHL